MIRALSMFGCLVALGCSHPTNTTPATPANEPTKVSAVSPPPTTQIERVKATEDTVGTKGKDYGGGIYTEPLRQRWRIADRLTLQAVQHAINLFNGLEGRYPASHEEFMEKVVRENNIKLPALPPGQRYVYDPEMHELMVEREAAAKS